jgi:hypothetical protein
VRLYGELRAALMIFNDIYTVFIARCARAAILIY